MITINEILNDPILFGLYFVMGIIVLALFYYMYKDFVNDFKFKRKWKDE